MIGDSRDRRGKIIRGMREQKRGGCIGKGAGRKL